MVTQTRKKWNPTNIFWNFFTNSNLRRGIFSPTFFYFLFSDPPISTDHCDWLYGIFGHETSCTRYWTCWNGTATEQFCIGGLLYNEETHACDWPQNVGGCQKHRKFNISSENRVA